MPKRSSVKHAAAHAAPAIHQAPLIPPLVSVKPTRLIIEVEHGCVSAVYSSHPATVELLDHDAIGVGNVKAEDAADLIAAIKTMNQVY